MEVRSVLLGQGIQPSKSSVSELKFYLVLLFSNLGGPGGDPCCACFSYFIFAGIFTFKAYFALLMTLELLFYASFFKGLSLNFAFFIVLY